MLTQRHGTSLSFSDGKYRSWFDDNFPGMVVGGKPQLQYAFDGTHLMIGQDNGLDARGNPQRLVTRFTPENSGHGPDARFVNDEYFTFAGYHLPVTSGELRERRPVRSLIDDLLQNGGTLAAVERIDASGRQLLRLRIFTGERTAKAIHPGPKEGVSVLELDPQLNYALVRSEERTPEGLLYYRLDCADFTRLQGRDLHLPRKITATRFAATVGRPRFYAEPITTTSYDVVEMNTAPIASEQFALKLEPRTTLIEYTPGDGRKHSYVDEAGALKEGFPPTSTGDAGPATKPAAGR